MKNSRIYTVDCVTGDISYFPLISGGRRFEGHTGGLQYLDGYIYLANEGNSLYKFTAASVLQKSGTTIEIGDPITLNSNTSFVYGKDEYLYVGEFHKEEAYPCENIIEYDGKTHNAIVEKYHISDLTKQVQSKQLTTAQVANILIQINITPKQLAEMLSRHKS